MRLRVSPRPLLALLLALSVATGSAAPSLAAFSDWWPFGSKAAPEVVPDPVPYTATLSVTGADSRLEKDLRRASALIARQSAPASGLTGLLARARQDIASLTAVLYENARYAAEVAILIDGRPLDSVGPFDAIAARPVPVTIRISVGAPFVFGRITSSPLPPGVDLARLGLVPGKPAGSATILNAEAAIAQGWRKSGHPLVQVQPRDTTADHRTNTLDVAFRVDPGPLANFGRVAVTGTKDVNADLVLRRSGIDRGEQYSSDVTTRAENRLRDLGVFDSVRVATADALDPDGTIPVTIIVSERPKHAIGGSVTFSNTEGLGLSAFWQDRNLFGGAEQLQLSGGVSRLLEGALDPDFRFAATFKKPAVFDPMTDFTLSAQVYRETTDTYRVTAADGDVGLSHIFSDVLTGSADVDLTRSQTITSTSTEDHLLATLTGKLDWDTRDNRLDPNSGFRAELMAAPAYDFLQQAPFATFHADFAAYKALGEADRFVLAGRVAADVLTVGDIDNVAADRRIYAGGAGSVRGYAYRSLGPTDSSGTVIGGRSAFTVSGELRYRINDQFGAVAFVDAGNAFPSILPSFDDLRIGAGVGLRYLTPIGPVRLDLAVPLTRRTGDPSFEIYVGLGQAF